MIGEGGGYANFSTTMAITLRARTLDLEAFARGADWLAVAVAVSLPWSTTATGILIVLWLAAVLPTVSGPGLRDRLATPAGGLPVLLWALAAVGMLWADVSWGARFAGLGSFHRLLLIPLLLTVFGRSDRGIWVLFGFLASATAVLLLSWLQVMFPALSWREGEHGIPVKDYIFQSESFLICAFALLWIALDEAAKRRWRVAAALGVFIALFLANIAFVATGRTTMLVAPFFVLLLGWRRFGWKGLFVAGLIGCVGGATISLASPYLRGRLLNTVQEFQAYRTRDSLNSTALHLEFLIKSASFVETAPIIGHGTGAIREQFRDAAVGEGSAASVKSDNPHNQILAVAIQLGLIGAALLLAMWIAHFMLFRGGGLVAWIGALIVIDNVVSSTVNSHLFDFTQGWEYVFGVGVIGGMALRQRATNQAAALKTQG